MEIYIHIYIYAMGGAAQISHDFIGKSGVALAHSPTQRALGE